METQLRQDIYKILCSYDDKLSREKILQVLGEICKDIQTLIKEEKQNGNK